MARKAEIDVMEAEIRQENQEKGSIYVVSDCWGVNRQWSILARSMMDGTSCFRLD